MRSGGAGAFTADNFPVFDYMAPNVYVAADSNHGYKMIAVGRRSPRCSRGGHSSLLYPFRYERFATGDLHPVSHSPVSLELMAAPPVIVVSAGLPGLRRLHGAQPTRGRSRRPARCRSSCRTWRTRGAVLDVADGVVLGFGSRHRPGALRRRRRTRR